MKVAVLAHIRHPISEPFKGGMEAHCHGLCSGLRSRGHDVTLFAAPGSDDPKLVPIVDQPYECVLPFDEWQGTATLGAYQHRAFANAFDCLLDGNFDVVHNNSLFAPIIGWCAEVRLPCVTSQHVPPFGDMRRAVIACAALPGVETTVTSEHQCRLWPQTVREKLTVVHNGIDTNLWLPESTQEQHYTWVGRISPNKGTGDAVAAALRAGVRLQVFGPIEDTTYFECEVAPHLNAAITYEGHLGYDKLRSVIARSRGAMVTPKWDEPFGLVAAEALASGTPVIGYDRGALAEVVGDCGILVPDGDIHALAQAIKASSRLDRVACRERAVAKFSVNAMIEGYEACYASAICSAGTAGSPRATRSSISSSALEALA